MAGLPFDVQGARDAGYTDAQIVDELQKSGKVPFDFAGATKAGHSATDILGEVAPQPSGYWDNVKQGYGEALEGVGNTLGKLGATNVGPALQKYGKAQEPTNFVPTPIFDENGKFNGLSGIGHTLARGLAPGAASIGAAAMAAPILPEAGVIAAGALPGILADTGNEIDKTGSVPRGIATSLGENAVSALPVGRFLGGAAPVTKVGMAGVGGALKRLAQTSAAQGIASGAGAATGDIIRSGSVNPVDVANAGVGGAAGAAVFAGTRKTLPEILNARKYSDIGNDPAMLDAAKMAANRVQAAAGGENLQGSLLHSGPAQRAGAAAYNKATQAVSAELGDAVSKLQNPLPTDANNVLKSAMAGEMPNQRDYATLATGLGNDPQGANVLNLVRQAHILNIVGDTGHVVGNKFTGGLGGMAHNILSPEHVAKSGLVGLMGLAAEEGAGHVIAFSPTTLGFAAGGAALGRALDNITGAQAPAGRFVRNFANGGDVRTPPVLPPQAPTAPQAAPVSPTGPSIPLLRQPWAQPAPQGPVQPPVAGGSIITPNARASMNALATLAKLKEAQAAPAPAPAPAELNPLALPTSITGPAKNIMRGASLAQKMYDATNPAQIKSATDLMSARRANAALDQMNGEGGGDANNDTDNDKPRAAALAKVSKANGQTKVNDEPFPMSSYAHLPADKAADAVLKDARIGKDVKFASNFRAGVLTRITKERQAMAQIGAEVPGLPMPELTARLEGRSSQADAKAYRESIRKQYPQASGALDKYLSDDIIKGLWKKKGA